MIFKFFLTYTIVFPASSSSFFIPFINRRSKQNPSLFPVFINSKYVNIIDPNTTKREQGICKIFVKWLSKYHVWHQRVVIVKPWVEFRIKRVFLPIVNQIGSWFTPIRSQIYVKTYITPLDKIKKERKQCTKFLHMRGLEKD